jgi:ketosteroid isomerase-like protein
MKNMLLMLLLFSAALPAQPVKAEKNAKTEEGIKKLEAELAGLIMSGDAEKYAGYLADDYVLINAAGGVISKDQIVGAIKASGGASRDSLIPDNLNVRVYGETAVLNGHLTWKGTENGQKISRESLFTKVFVRKKGHWYMVNNQGTPLPPKPAPRQ